MHLYEFMTKSLRLAVDYLLTIPPMCDLKGEEELRDFLGGGYEANAAVSSIMGRTVLIPVDMKGIIRALGVEMGLTLRFPSGETITFFPAGQENTRPVAEEKINVGTNVRTDAGYEDFPFAL